MQSPTCRDGKGPAVVTNRIASSIARNSTAAPFALAVSVEAMRRERCKQVCALFIVLHRLCLSRFPVLCMLFMQFFVRKKVHFSVDTKMHDGLLPVHQIYESIIWWFFERKIGSVEHIYEYIGNDQLRHLINVYRLIGNLLSRAEESPRKTTYVLPEGGGRRLMVKYSVYGAALKDLQELVRQAHNRIYT